MLTVVAGIAIVVTAIVFIGVIAAVPLLAARKNPRPADQLAEMRRNEPATTSDDPGHPV
jgi:hypothetical protein